MNVSRGACPPPVQEAPAGEEINDRMSSALQAVVRAANLTGCGYLPVLTPASHVAFDTGKTASIEGSRTNPVSGIGWGM